MSEFQPNQRSQDPVGTEELAAAETRALPDPPVRPKEEELEDANTDLKRLERRDWWRLGWVLMVVILLAAGVSFLAYYAGDKDVLRESEVHIATTGLLAVVGIFVLFTIYQQVTIVALRRQIAAQVGMLATLELLRPVPKEEKRASQRRQFHRFYFDAVLTVEAGSKRGAIYGRTSDVSEGGLGAVLPEPLGSGTTVRLEFPLADGSGEKFSIHALVRHRRGFYHGMEFQHITGPQRSILKQICANAAPVDPLADYASRG